MMATDHTEAASKPPATPTFIERVAPELQLQILSHLSPKEMQKFREVNCYFRDLIDLEENQVICAQPEYAQSHRRLEKFVKTNVDYDIDAVDENGLPCGFINALVAYDELRGISKKACFDYVVSVSFFVNYWIRRVAQSDPESSMTEDDIQDLRLVYGHIIKALHNLHLHHHVPGCELSAFEVSEYRAGLEEESAIKAMRLKSADQVEKAIARKVVDGIFRNVPVHFTDNYIDCPLYDSPYPYLINGPIPTSIPEHRRQIRVVLETAPDEEETPACYFKGKVTHYQSLTAIGEEKKAEEAWRAKQRAELEGLEDVNKYPQGFEEPIDDITSEDEGTAGASQRLNDLSVAEARAKASNNRFFMFEQEEEADDESDEDQDDADEDAGFSDEEYGGNASDYLDTASLSSNSDDEDFDELDSQAGEDYVLPARLGGEGDETDVLEAKLTELFDLPALPASLPYHYFMRSRWAFEMFLGYIKGETKLTLIQKAALLDDVVIW